MSDNSSHSEVINATIAELGFVLVLVFALFASVGLAGDDSETPPRVIVQQLEQDDRVSCLYIPLDRTIEHDFDSRPYYVQRTGLGDDLNILRDEVPVDNSEEKILGEPFDRSFIQIYWGAYQDFIREEVGYNPKAFNPDLVYVKYNLDRKLIEDNELRKPFVYLDGKAESAVRVLNKELYRYIETSVPPEDVLHPNHHELLLEVDLLQLSGATNRTTDAPAGAIEPQDFPHNFLIMLRGPDALEAFVDNLIQWRTKIRDSYDCWMFFDGFNFPHMSNTAVANKLDETLGQGEFLNRDRYVTILNRLFGAPKWRERQGAMNSFEEFPEYRDNTD